MITTSISENEQGKKTIMAVDNMSLMLDMLESIVVGSGYKFAGTKSVNNVMGMIESNNPDLLLLSADMPDMDGYEFAERMSRHGRDVPMIFLSDKPTKEKVVKAHRVGVKDYIMKPVDRKTVLNKIAKQFA